MGRIVRADADAMTYIRHIEWSLMFIWLKETKKKDVIPGLSREKKRNEIRSTSRRRE